MCLATDPRVLLLDEPLAGMGAEETERMLALLIGAQSRIMRCCSSSTTWTRCFSRRRPHHGDGQRRGHRERHARGHSAAHPGVIVAYLGEGH